MQAASARLTRIAPEIPVTNLNTTLAYYVRRLGFEIAMTMPDSGYAIVERDGIAIHLFEAEAGAASPAGLHIFTPDLDQLFADLVERGARIVQPIELKPWGNREFRVEDESGNVLKFTEPLAD